MKKIVLPVATFAIAVLLSGCGPASNADMSKGELREWVGKNVRVQFRRDALGAAATLPVPPATSAINGAETCVVGQLMKVESEGIVIGPEQHPKWIPREVILFLEANP